MSDDLVKRLRAFRCSLHETPEPLCEEAASALVAKDAEIARLMAALGGIVLLEPNRFHGGKRNDLVACAAWEIANGAIRARTGEG